MDEVLDPMRQHYTQSRRCRNFRTWEMGQFSPAQAYDFLEQMRFADKGGKPYCLRCGHEHVTRRIDVRFHCPKCRQAFSILTGTAFEHNRVPLAKLLVFVAHFVSTASANPSPEYGARLGLSQTTSFKILRKIRVTLAMVQALWKLRGKVEADTAAFGGYKRKLNSRKDEATLKAMGLWKLPPKKALGAVRERQGRVLVGVAKDEKGFVPFIRDRVEPGSKLYVGSAGAWLALGDTFVVKTINHKEFYWTPEASTQYAEVFFRRVRRAEKNYIHISGDYLELYGAEAAFRETYCRHSEAEKFLRVWAACFRHPPLRGPKRGEQNE